MNKSTIQIHCPHCQHQQTEPDGVISTNCRACGHYIRVSESILKPTIRSPKATKILHCPQCEGSIRVVDSALSSTCPQCSSHLNLQNYKLSAGDDTKINTLGNVTIQGRRRYEGNEIIAARIEVACRVRARLVAREEAILSGNGTLDGKLESPKISITSNASARARILITPLLEIDGEIRCALVRARKIIIRAKGNLSAKNIYCEEILVEQGGILRGRLTTFNMEAQALHLL